MNYPIRLWSISMLLLSGLFLLALIYTVRACVADAKRRGQSPLLVSALVILFFPLGLVVWLLARPEPVDPGSGRGAFRLDDYRLQ